ncbi:8-amino-7-oxononanoate synthase [Boletus edulis BED1]|uniref:8-amino-7-oxononanoate synthase n=1 Tax=Boletus edulis BED1 TaxID=1328754 RepID=A0AAD4BS97_BOLED|nr:8-amino-7-oxononanoate synthase [Boletus edulis BED1]
MSQSSHLLDSLQQAIAHRDREATGMHYLDYPLPSYAPDLFSNDYLSLSTDQPLRDVFLSKVQEAASGHLFGSTGSRILTGNSTEYNQLETAFKHFFGAPSALLFGSGFNANLGFLSAVPQKNDVIIYDEFIHTSCREGIRVSSRPSYRFSHNSAASFEECLRTLLQKHPQITQGTSTVFVVLESLYSMDGDFCPLPEIVGLVENLVPAGHAHIVVDEAHTSGICGPNGTGYVSHLGLNDRVHTKVHTFGKGWGFHGAVVLTSPIIRDYLANFAKSLVYSTSMPYTDIYALEACLGVISSARGQELRKNLNRLSRYAREKLFISLREVPDTILSLDKSNEMIEVSYRGLCSPIIPVFTPRARSLTEYLLQRGYAVTSISYPATKTARIRVAIHARNTEEEIDSLVNELLAWAGQQESVSSHTRGIIGTARTGESHMRTRAKL